MEHEPKGLRAFLTDFRLGAYYAGFLFAMVAGAITGTYLGWWAYVWNVVLPIRVLIVLGGWATVFVIVYGGLFTLHYYFGWPKQNPLSPSPGTIGGPDVLPVRQYAVIDTTKTIFLTIHNDGPTDYFVAQITGQFGTANFIAPPFPLRWEFEQTAKVEIVKGAGHRLQVMRPVLDETGEAVLAFEFFAPNGTDSVAAKTEDAAAGVRLYHEVNILIALQTAAGATKEIHLAVEVAIFSKRLMVKPRLIAPLHG